MPESSRRKRRSTTRRAPAAATRLRPGALQRLVSHVDEVLYEVRFRKGSGGRVAFVSDSVKAILGYRPRDFLRNPNLWASLLHPDDSAAAAETTERLRERPEGLVRVYRMRHKQTGEWRWMEDKVAARRDRSGRLIGLFGAARDVTARERTEEALRTSELWFRAVFNAVGEAVFVISPDGCLRDLNPAAERIFGYTVDELRGRSTEILHVDRQHYEEFRALVAGPFAEGMTARFEFEVKRRNGEVFPSDRVVSQLRGADGEPIGIVSVVRDISEQRKADRMLRESREQLRALSQHLLEALELERRHLARGLHDDIGQLLTAVRLNIQTAQRTTGAETAAELLDESLAVIDKGIEAVRGFALDLRPPLLDDVGLAAALRWYLDRQAARAGLAVNLVTCALNCRLPGDVETACFRVAQEAVTNVVRHASARKVEVEVRCQDGWADLFIRDDGVGFDVAERARRTESVGLLGMRERVLLLGGEITIDSGSERGTTVWARIPVPKGAA